MPTAEPPRPGGRLVDLADVFDVRCTVPARVAVVAVRPGIWADPGPGAHVVVAGALLQRVHAGRRVAGDLLGPGDVFDVAPDAAPFRGEVRALERSVVAPLRLTRVLGHDPQLALAVFAALDRRFQARAAQHVLTQVPQIEDRIRGLLPGLADRWGVMTAEGVVLPSLLTHRVLSELCGVRRPSFTTAAVRLEEAGILLRLPDGRWRIGDDPGRVADSA